MAYQALYRKFRPLNFDSVIGQEYIIKTLKNQIKTKRISHAYLFCGTRGTGKTSTAKIFAKAINCMDSEDGEPCGKCELCYDISVGRSLNVIEIDAASNNGVDNIREIREEVKYPPATGKYKAYIIDEVHMLSSGAFNALLKTLEEPPEHVIFILATTDPQKVPPTILSRCQRFNFKRISADTISETLKKYVKSEEVICTPEALKYIAHLGDGSMRDSLSILDQCISFYPDKKITLIRVMEIMGAVDRKIFFDMADAVLNKNTKSAMDIIKNIISMSDISQFITDFIVHMRNLLIILTVNNPDLILDISDNDIDEFKKQSKNFSAEEIIYIINCFSELSKRIKYEGNQRIILEVEIIKLCSDSYKMNLEGLASKISFLERSIKNGVQIVQNKENEKTEEVKKKSIETKDKEFNNKNKPVLTEDIKQMWRNIVSSINDDAIKTCFGIVEIKSFENNCAFLVSNNLGVIDVISKDEKLNIIKSEFKKYVGTDVEIRISTPEEYENSNINMNNKKGDDDNNFNCIIKDKLSDADIVD